MRGLLVGLLIVLAVCGGQSWAAPAAPTAPCAPPRQEFTAGSWTMVVLPDTQSYVDHKRYVPILEQMLGWVVANKTPHNIQFVLQEGDVVYQNAVTFASQSSGDQSGPQQWRNARQAFRLLDGVLPYIIAPGNHDFGISNADFRKTQFTTYFTVQGNPLNDPHRGGILAELGPSAAGGVSLENAAYCFTAPGGRKLLIIALEFGPRQAAVDWANSVAGNAQYKDYTKVLLTHAYLYHDNTRYNWAQLGAAQANNPHEYRGTNHDTNDGEELWNELVRRHPGFQLVLCGHVAGDMVGYLQSVNDFGEPVHQLLFNAQFLPEGGQGWLRLLEFLPDGKTVQVRTYSPYFAADGDPATVEWRTGADDDFRFELMPVSG